MRTIECEVCARDRSLIGEVYDETSTRHALTTARRVVVRDVVVNVA